MATQGRSQGAEARRDTDYNMVKMERSLAAILGIAALVLGAIGLLRGFGLIGPEGVDIPAAGELGGLQAAVQPAFWEGILWMLPALAFGAIAWSYAGGQAHHMHDVQSSMRGVAMVMVIVTIALGALAYLVGFGLINTNAVPTDGVLWGMTSLISALVTSAAYSAIPSPVADEDYLVALVESRVGAAGPAAAPTRPGTEPTA